MHGISLASLASFAVKYVLK